MEFSMLSDADARIFATDPSNNVVLEASAGTGKTSILVTRYLNLLRADVDPAHILAITFTRRAAAEMRERIIRELRLASELSQADKVRWQNLRYRLGEITISTIDAFCLSLLREFPLEADLDPGFTVADETESPRRIKQALDRTLRICTKIACNDSDVAMVLAQLGTARTRSGLAHLLNRRLIVPTALRRFLSLGPSEISGESICRKTVGRLQVLLEKAPGSIKQFVSDGPLGHPRFLMLSKELSRLDDFKKAGCPALRNLIDQVRDHFLTKEGNPRLKFQVYNVSHCSSASAWKRHKDSVVSIAPAIRESLLIFDRDLNFIMARGVRRMFMVAESQYRKLLESHAILDFSDVLERALNLLRQMDEFAQSRYRLESRYFHVLVDEFQDTNRAQWDLVWLLVQSWGEGFGLVHDAPVAPSVFIVGDRKQSIYRFRDADVSILREAGDCIEQLRPNGDVRRAIVHSFRAVPGLLEFVNDLFSAIHEMGDQTDGFTYGAKDRFPIDRNTVAASSDSKVSNYSGPVLGLVASDQVDLCAQTVAAEVERFLAEETVRDRDTGIARSATAGDVAILFRSRESHRAIEDALEARNIPTYVYKGLGFLDTDEIKDFTALVRFLADPTSNLRAAAFLRSRVVRLSDEALCQLAPDLSTALTASKLPASASDLKTEDQRVLTQIRRCVAAWLPLVDRLTPAELIDFVLTESAYVYELKGPRLPQARENLKKIRGLVRRLQNRGYATLRRISEYLDGLSVDESNAIVDAVEAVSLMTIHAAKGLEFPVVFLADLARGTGGTSLGIRVVPDCGDGIPSVSVGSFKTEADINAQAIDREETKRLLYVGATRARDRLYLASVFQDGKLKPGRGSLADVFPDSLLQTFADTEMTLSSDHRVSWIGPSGKDHTFSVYRPSQLQSPLVSKIESLSRKLSSPTGIKISDNLSRLASINSIQRTTVTEYATRNTSYSHFGEVLRERSDTLTGNLVHRLIQFENCELRDYQELTERTVALLRSDELVEADSLEIVIRNAAKAYQSIIQRPDVVSLLASECLFEVPFSLRLEQDLDTSSTPTNGPSGVIRGTIDCIVRRSDRRITVLEFKTGSRKPEHQVQLNLYLAAARKLFQGMTVDGMLIYA